MPAGGTPWARITSAEPSGALLALEPYLPAEGRALDLAGGAGALNESTPLLAEALCGTASVLGHCFPLYLRFKGGKGVATSLGVFLVIDPLMALAGFGVFAAVYALLRVASLGSVAAAIAFPVFLWLSDRPDSLVHLSLGIAVLIVWKHRSNLARVLRGEEHKV